MKCWGVEDQRGRACQIGPNKHLLCLSQLSQRRPRSSQNIPLQQTWSPCSSGPARNSARTVSAMHPPHRKGREETGGSAPPRRVGTRDKPSSPAVPFSLQETDSFSLPEEYFTPAPSPGERSSGSGETWWGGQGRGQMVAMENLS